jgi:class 3 adenylate cyclase
MVTVSETPEKLGDRRVHADGARAERCPTCGAAMPQGFRFCGQCGRALAATLAPMPGDVVTIAFVDLEGYTAFASRVDDDEVRELIRGFHGLVRDQVGRHGGFEVKQMGDGFMLAFSSPARAVACAAGIQRAAAARGSDGLATAIEVSAGLNSGAAIREGDDFFGHTVNVASRIADRARGGQVLVSEETRRLAGDVEGALFRDRGRRSLRGLHGRYRLFEVVWAE